MRKGYRTRRTYAANYRLPVSRFASGTYATETAEGIKHQTCSGKAQGFTSPVIERRRADGSPLFFAESDKFQDRYYALYKQADGSWFFSGDSKLATTYIAKVEAFVAEQAGQRQVVAA